MIEITRSINELNAHASAGYWRYFALEPKDVREIVAALHARALLIQEDIEAIGDRDNTKYRALGRIDALAIRLQAEAQT